MKNEELEVKKINPEAYPGNDLDESEIGPRFSGGRMLFKSKQLLRGFADRVGKIGKDSYITALSSIGASRRAGKTAVLKMEITSRKRKMKEVFTQVGEMVYKRNGNGSASSFQDVSLQALIDALKSYDREIKEIEEYIISLGESGNGEKIIGEGDGESGDIRVDSTRRNKVAQALKESERAVALSTFVEAVKDEDEAARLKALKQLFKFDGAEVIPHLVGALKDKDVQVRSKAALYLGWKVAVSAAPALIITALDRNASVRRNALEALGELGSKEAVPALIKGLDDQDYDVRKVAYKSLTKITGEFIDFIADGPLSGRFKSMQKWEKWWKGENK